MRHHVVPIQLNAKATQLDVLLPQYQCRQCGYVDCAHYAQALTRGKASEKTPVTCCTPGGKSVAEGLSQAMSVLLPQDAVFEKTTMQCVEIIEADCIGCTRCLRECPLDALIGAPGRMHSVLPSLCSGCGLCVLVCPVDCMKLVPTIRAWTAQDADDARTRYRARLLRLMKQSLSRASPATQCDETHERRQTVQDALSKARARRLQWTEQKMQQREERS